MAQETRNLQDSRADRRDWTNRTEISRQLLRAVEQMLDAGTTFTELTVEQLVGGAGLPRSTFYLYFQDKSDLLLALIDEVILDLEASVHAWWNFPAGGTKADLREALRPEMDVYRRHRAVMVSASEAAAYDPGVRNRLDDLFEVSTGRMTTHLRASQAQGLIRPDVDVDAASRWIGTMIARGLEQLVLAADPEELERLLTAEADIIWNVLYRGAG
ncbi:MAG: TetR/AcrR family transcriptional regulator, ethionamide resistance regulator [Actinomycetota bacterium]|jgi:AcrR family transcriptional regulator|nr:TetR/AcrR family transcriptional regulator, ethionamide resistance regulator [Actinomycetota bacterium]